MSESSESYKKVSSFKKDYEPVGTIVKMSDLDVYVTKPKDKSKPFKKAIIVCYDIYGFHEVAKQHCDLLAEAGFLAILPDYQRGQAWTDSQIKSEGISACIKFITENFPTERLEKDTLNVVENLRSEYGVEDFGFSGFCWGGILGAKICQTPIFDACVLIHYAPYINQEMFKNSRCPIAFLPSATDLDGQPFIDAMKDKPFAEKNFQKRFEDMKHGFAGAHSDLTNELIVKRVNEVVEISIKFFHDNIGVKY